MEYYSILLVDHQPDYLEESKKILQVHPDNFQIDNARSAEECMRKIIRNHYDALLLNYQLNGEDGLRLLGRIKALREKLPVIMLVDENHETVADQAMKQGADDYIMKVSGDQTALPFTIQQVIRRNRVKGNSSPLKSELIHTKKQPQPEPEARPTPLPETRPTPPPESAAINPPKKKIPTSGPGYIIDQKGRFLSANDKMLAFSGYTEEELMELKVSDLLPVENEHHFLHWFDHLEINGEKAEFSSEVISKYGQSQPMKLVLRSMRDKAGKIVAYQGKFQSVQLLKTREHDTSAQMDVLTVITEAIDIMNSSLHGPINHLLERIIESAAQLFNFKKVTLALLNRKKRIFIKQAMVGTNPKAAGSSSVLEVPAAVIDEIFTEQFKLKVLYYNQKAFIDFQTEQLKQRLFHEKQGVGAPPQFEWHNEDMLILNLVDKNKHTFGYVSFESPLKPTTIDSDLVYHLELYGKLISQAIENHYHYSMLERRNRRLKQILVTSNIFKLYLNLNDLLKEIVWSVKFSLDFNLVSLALVTSRSGMLELRAAACDDKIKQMHLEELRFDLSTTAKVLEEKYKRSKSYFITEPRSVFQHLKNIYYGARKQTADTQPWKRSYLILVPIKTRDHKISGFLMVDDPGDGQLPGLDILRTLEILANQIAIAIDNRTMYFQMKKKLRVLEKVSGFSESMKNPASHPGLQGLVHKFFK